MMKKALIAMAAMFLLIVFPCGGLWSLLSHLIGGGTAETFLYFLLFFYFRSFFLRFLVSDLWWYNTIGRFDRRMHHPNSGGNQIAQRRNQKR